MPLLSGGLCTRWQLSPSTHPTTSSILTWQQVQEMDVEAISKLSPSEKMDIYLGYKDFRITKNELTRRGPERSNVLGWEGFCNGVRLAGVLLPEPEKDILVKSQSGDEIYIQFSPADLKALGGAVYYYTQWYASLGENNKRKPNAGYFDMLLRFAIGNQNRCFFIDIQPGEQKWNETVVGYKRELINQTVASAELRTRGITKIINVKTTLYLLGEIGINQSNSLTKPFIEAHQLVNTWETNYLLYVNDNNEIIDGEWKKFDPNPSHMFLNYPDYIWLGSGKGTDEVTIGNRNDNNSLLPFLEVQNLFLLSVN
jgi:hypothetical protein